MLVTCKKNQSGFTLVELAIVLVIIGVLLGGFIGTLSSRIENTRKSDTQDELEDIKQSLIAYAFVNGRLPCPDCDAVAGTCVAADVGDGVEDANGAQCKESENLGTVPWVTLGLGRGDSWGTRYRYVVQNEYADNNTDFTLSGATGPGGQFTIDEPNFSVVTVPPGATPKALATGVVAVIMSHGKNSYGGVNEDGAVKSAVPGANIDETENIDDDNDYYSRSETDSTANINGGEFDDIIIWISEYELKAKMVEAGALP